MKSPGACGFGLWTSSNESEALFKLASIRTVIRQMFNVPIRLCNNIVMEQYCGYNAIEEVLYVRVEGQSHTILGTIRGKRFNMDRT